MMHAPSLDGRRLAPVADVDGGEVGPETVFENQEDGGEVWASDTGGAVRRGFLVGTRDGDVLRFRYSQIAADGETSSERCVSRIRVTDDGRLVLEETWAWDSRPGRGTSTVAEIV